MADDELRAERDELVAEVGKWHALAVERGDRLDAIRDRLDAAFAYAEGCSLPAGPWKEVLDGINDLRVELAR